MALLKLKTEKTDFRFVHIHKNNVEKIFTLSWAVLSLLLKLNFLHILTIVKKYLTRNPYMGQRPIGKSQENQKD